MTATPATRPTPSRTGSARSAQVVDEQERRINLEIDQLIVDIRRIGPTYPDPSPNVLFGELFDDDEAQQYYEALVGTLKCAKKRGVISFRGQMLLKGIHDATLISIIDDASSVSASASARRSSRRITPRIVTPKATSPMIKTPTVYSYSKSAQKSTQKSARSSTKKTPRQQHSTIFSPKKFTFASPPPAELCIKENEKFDVTNSSIHSDQMKEQQSDVSGSPEKVHTAGEAVNSSDPSDPLNSSNPSNLSELQDPLMSSPSTSDANSSLSTPVSQAGVAPLRDLSSSTPSTGTKRQEKATKSTTKSPTRKTLRSRHSTGAQLGKDTRNPASTKESPTATSPRVTPVNRHSNLGIQRKVQSNPSYRNLQSTLCRSASVPINRFTSSSRTMSLRSHSDEIASRTEDEVHRILHDIRRTGHNPGEPTVKFGELFDDDEVQNTYEALIGTLRSAKRQGLIAFKGQMLLKGMHDHVVISVVE